MRVSHLSAKDFTRITIRNGTKGTIHALYHMRKVWVLHEPTGKLLPLHLLIGKNADRSVKFALCFFNDRVTMKRLAKAQAQRTFVERVFEEGKNIVGMGDFQVRSWDGFHKHMALCGMNLLFLMEQKLALKKSIGKVTAYQIQELINATITTLSTIGQVIQKLLVDIPRYQNQIENQAKVIT